MALRRAGVGWCKDVCVVTVLRRAGKKASGLMQQQLSNKADYDTTCERRQQMRQGEMLARQCVRLWGMNIGMWVMGMRPGAREKAIVFIGKGGTVAVGRVSFWVVFAVARHRRTG